MGAVVRRQADCCNRTYLLRAKTLRTVNQVQVIKLLREIGTYEAAYTLTSSLLDGYDNYKDSAESRKAVYSAVTDLSHRLGEPYYEEMSGRLESLSIGTRDDPRLYSAVAYSIASLGVAPGVELLLAPLP